MTKSETFILNFRAIADASGRFTVNINIQGLKEYKKFKAFVKDFVLVSPDLANTNLSPNIITLNSNTFRYINNFDNAGTNRMQGLESRVLATVSIKYPFFSNENESYFDILPPNGAHTFWVENFVTNTIVTLNDFFFTIVINASE